MGTFTFNINEASNNAPVITPIQDRSVTLQQVQPVEFLTNSSNKLVFNHSVTDTIVPSITDSDGDNLTVTFSQNSGPSTTVITENSGEYSLDYEGKAEDVIGDYTYTITATDPDNASDSENVNINVDQCEGFYNRLIYDFDETLFESSIYPLLTGTLDLAVETSSNFYLYSIANVNSPFDITNPSGTKANFSTIQGPTTNYDPTALGGGESGYLSTDAYQDVAPVFIKRENGRVIVDFNYFTKCNQLYETIDIYALIGRLFIRNNSATNVASVNINIFINDKQLQQTGTINHTIRTDVNGVVYTQTNINANGTGNDTPMLYSDGTNFTHIDYLNLVNSNGVNVIRFEHAL